MQQLWDIVGPYVNGKTILWAMWGGLALLLLGLFWPNKERRFMLLRFLQMRHDGVENNGLTTYLEGISLLPMFRWFALKPDSDDYAKINELIRRAGGLKGMGPNTIQLARVLMPPIFFVVGTILYLVRTRMAYLQFQYDLLHPKETSTSTLMAIVPKTVNLTPPHASMITILWIGVAAAVLYMAPIYLLKQAIKGREKKLDEEIHISERFIVTLLESKMTVYEILRILRDTMPIMRPFLTLAVNEFYVIGPERTLTNLGERLQNSEFAVVCSVLKQATTNTQEYTLPFLRQHMSQFEQVRNLNEERKIRMKPLLYTTILGMPLAGIVVIYFYPFLSRAITMLQF